MGRVRIAYSSDIEQVTEIFREGFEPSLLPYTILGCSGINKFVLDRLNDNRCLFVVHVEQNRINGAAEFRRDVSHIFLNHIFVRASEQKQGIGRLLLADGLRLVRNCGQLNLYLDVLKNNSVAQRWYTSLGFSIESKSTWREIKLLPASDIKSWSISDFAQADLRQTTYGFSQFNLNIDGKGFRIGRLGKKLFRFVDADTTDCDIRNVVHALYYLDPDRTLLWISHCEDYRQENTLVATSLRLTANINDVLGYLEMKKH